MDNQINFESIMKVMRPVQKLQATFTTREQYDLLNEIIVGYSRIGDEQLENSKNINKITGKII